MVIAREISENTLHIEHILCDGSDAFKSLIRLCKERYPGYTLEYNRNGKLKTLNQERLKRYE